MFDMKEQSNLQCLWKVFTRLDVFMFYRRIELINVSFLTLINRKRPFNVNKRKIKQDNFQVGWILFIGIAQFDLVRTSKAL